MNSDQTKIELSTCIYDLTNKTTSLFACYTVVDQEQQQQQSLFTFENTIYKNNCSSHLVE